MQIKIKTVIVGNSTVGKTSIILRIFQNTFNQKTTPTIGVDYQSRKQKINKKQCTVQLWDSTGQDKFRTVVANFFRQANGVFLVFDINDDKSVQAIDYWLKQLDKYLDDVPKVLLANKCDLKEQLSQFAKNKVEKYMEEYDLKFFKVSAKKGTNIQQAYQILLEQSYKNAVKNLKNINKQSIFTIDGKNSKNQSKKKGGCC